MKKILCFVVFAHILSLVSAIDRDPFWTLVMAGKNSADPVIWNRHIYTIGRDRALNCISTSGSFIWRQNTKSYGKFITASFSGLIFVITETGGVEAFSSQGIPIWKFQLDEVPSFPAYFSNDGRLFILQSKSLLCFNRHGVLKWKRELKSPPSRNISETGAGEVILTLQNGDFLKLSIFGHITESKRLKKTVSVITPAPNGYLIAFTDNSLAYYKIQDGSRSVWQTNESSMCKALNYKNESILIVSENGKISMRNISDNSEIWSLSVNNSFSEDVNCYSIRNEYYITSKGFGCLVTDDGTLKWECRIPETGFLPVITENGMIVGVRGKIMNAYRMEAKIIRQNEYPDIATHKYGIISKDEFYIPMIIEQNSTMSMLKDIETAILNGTLAENEPKYANMLARIITNTNKSHYFPSNYNSFERSRAAELLGKMGSYEYRECLINEAIKKPDLEFSIGIIKGLGEIAYDPDGRTVEAIKILISGTNGNNSRLMSEACKTLENLIKFGNHHTAKNAVYVLFSIINGGYSDNIKNLARQIIKNIVQ